MRGRERSVNSLMVLLAPDQQSEDKPPLLSPEVAPAAPRKTHICTSCQGEFPDALSLTRHKRTHGNRSPYACATCGRMFSLYSALVNHERCHLPGDDVTFPCPRCSAVFLHQSSLKAHVRRHEDAANPGPEKRPYQCHTCLEWVANEGALAIHMKRHDDMETPRVCTLCGNAFSNDTILHAHQV
jgi:uncharacterized Zn-finger protein